MSENRARVAGQHYREEQRCRHASSVASWMKVSLLAGNSQENRRDHPGRCSCRQRRVKARVGACLLCHRRHPTRRHLRETSWLPAPASPARCRQPDAIPSPNPEPSPGSNPKSNFWGSRQLWEASSVVRTSESSVLTHQCPLSSVLHSPLTRRTRGSMAQRSAASNPYQVKLLLQEGAVLAVAPPRVHRACEARRTLTQ